MDFQLCLTGSAVFIARNVNSYGLAARIMCFEDIIIIRTYGRVFAATQGSLRKLNGK